MSPMSNDELLRQLRAEITDLRAKVARLTSELDAYQGRRVLFCLDRDLDSAAIGSLDEPEGTILRATDTGRELELSGGTWRERARA